MTGAVAIVLAAGQGRRLGREEPKAFAAIGGHMLVELAVASASACSSVGRIVVTVPIGFEDRIAFDAEKPLVVVPGGESRQLSVRAALVTVPHEAEAVVCHDAARPLASSRLFSRVLDALPGADGVVPVLPVPDTVKRVRDGTVVGTERRDELALAQTPQAFRTEALVSAHQRALDEGKTFTDDAALLEWDGHTVRVVEGEPDNFKITTEEDLARAEAVLAARRSHSRG